MMIKVSKKTIGEITLPKELEGDPEIDQLYRIAKYIYSSKEALDMRGLTAGQVTTALTMAISYPSGWAVGNKVNPAHQYLQVLCKHRESPTRDERRVS
jgi:hypothetical protein